MGAGSEAEAATMMVWPMAPASVSVCTTWAIEERFCPMAQ